MASLRSLNLTQSGKVARLLIVDDDAQTVRLLATILRNEGYDVLKATGGQAAIEIALTEHPDLIILDLMMPGVDGFQVVKRLAQDAKARDIPIIICTAMDLTEEEKTLLNGQIKSIIQKTGNVKEELLAAVKRIERIRKPTTA